MVHTAPPTCPSHLPLPPAAQQTGAALCVVCATGLPLQRGTSMTEYRRKPLTLPNRCHSRSVQPACPTASAACLSHCQWGAHASLLPLPLQSETEIKAAVEALKKKGGGSSEEEQQEEESGEGGAHEGSGQDQTDVPHNSSPASGGGVRQRQTGHPQEARNVQASLAPPRRLPLTPPHPIPQPKGTTSLVVMWLLILMIFLLVGRRAYLSYSGETLKNFHP